jgi:hypothetical protein
MTGYYQMDFRLSVGWAPMTYWEMEESLLPDFLLHILDLHHSIECRDDMRVRRITYAEMLEAQFRNPDELITTYHGLHIHTSNAQ